MKEYFMFNIGDILELKKDIMIYDKGLICQVISIDEDNSNYGYVKILGNTHDKFIGKEKHANLTLFKLVRRDGFYV